MTTLKLTAYKGVNPEDGSDTLMVTVTSPEHPDMVDCIAFAADEIGLEAISDPEGVKVALSIGIWRMGKARPIALDFLAMPTTVQLWQETVEGGEA